ncbi:diguanylate cyclase [Desulforamulus reducens MI-1]|uniref:Diguanylate cyclase n=1 Tax=Desulforamulus reducens (strain ATCC BAA-1160 / DSM 100696 / MI-1) TaxID=349161 RepID=A4J6T6_DESRM|nr:MASE3 domain-containing protein [Desulforamulus reducens]ABO50789.1 diguanylate cyclase [Desulforamulus reducens MI-1]
MGLSDHTLKKLRMANLRLKLIIISLICLALYMGVTLLGFNHSYSSAMFLTIHTNIEFFCVFVALGTFTVTWYSYLNNCSFYSYFIGLGLLAVGFIDLFHFYSYEGMPHIFANACANHATQYHVIGRILMALTFLTSIFFYKKEICFVKRHCRFYLLMATMSLVIFVLVTVSFNSSLYPVMYVKDVGLTQAKVFIEYAIIALLVAAVLGYLRLYRQHMDTYLQLIISTLTISIFSELCFISYGDVYDTLNLLGHLFRFASYVLIYVAIFLNNVKKPYLQLVATRSALENANNALEEKVQERTRELQEANDRLVQAVTHDFLTGAINRLEFTNRFNQLKDMATEGTVHSVIALDFDSFKNINDTYGHGVGDECLKTFVQVTQEVIRPTDSVARFGGDEFMLLLPDTPREGARIVGEKIRNHLAKIANPPFTVSMGIAQWPNDGRKEKDLLAHADEALYVAKEKGKNQTV